MVGGERGACGGGAYHGGFEGDGFVHVDGFMQCFPID
jgi:hypothetical protein